jgi:hypothetical protein
VERKHGQRLDEIATLMALPENTVIIDARSLRTVS